MYPGSHDEQGIPLIRAADISEGRISETPTLKISKNVHYEYRRTALEGGECLLTLVGTPGISAIVPHSMAGWNVARAVAVLRLKEQKNARFLRYAFSSPDVKNTIRNWCNTTVQPTLNLGDIKKIPISWPPNAAREAITRILASFDDKIDLNRRTNETLEAMARALFRDWFVDFGPTRAKMAGEAPYLAPELWELFPDRLDDEGKPEGWQSWPLADLATLSKSSINPAQFSDEYFLHFSLPAFDKGMMPDLVKGEEIKSGKFSLPSNSILLSKLNPETPRVWMVSAHEEPYQRICSTEFMVLNPLQKDWLALIYCACLSQPFREILQGMVTGTSKSHQRVQPLAVMQTHLLHATDILMRQFGLTAQPLLAKINFNRNESNTLAQLRDLLLPKLMSGEISIRDAEKMLEDAA